MTAILSDVQDVVPDGVLEVDPDVLLQAEKVIQGIEHQARDLVTPIELHGIVLLIEVVQVPAAGQWCAGSHEFLQVGGLAHDGSNLNLAGF